MSSTSLLSTNTNIAALAAQFNLQQSTSALNQSLERLSTGLRINRSADDPSGLVISEFQRAQISGLGQAIRNVDRAATLAQTAEGGLSEINGLLIKIREIAVDSANNGALDSASLAANQANINSLLTTIDRIADTTRFGTFNLLDGSSGLTGVVDQGDADADVRFVAATDVGIPALTQGDAAFGQALDVVITQNARRAVVDNAGAQQTGNLAEAETLTVNGVAITLSAGLDQAGVISRINEFTSQTGVVALNDGGATILRTVQFGSGASIAAFSDTAAGTGGTTSGFGTTVLTNSGQDIAGTIGGGAATGVGNVLTGNAGQAGSGVSISVNATEGADEVETADVEAADNVAVSVINNSRAFHIGAFAEDSESLTLNRATTSAIGIGVAGSQFASLAEVSVVRVDAANDTIRVVDAAIGQISTQRGEIGAFQQNILEATKSNLQTQLINLREAEAIIRDTDFSTEITNFTNAQIRQQAATTVLGLANQNALAILGLLQANN